MDWILSLNTKCYIFFDLDSLNTILLRENETIIVPTQAVPPIHQPSGHSKSYDNNYNTKYFIIIRYLPMCTHCLKKLLFLEFLDLFLCNKSNASIFYHLYFCKWIVYLRFDNVELKKWKQIYKLEWSKRVNYKKVE